MNEASKEKESSVKITRYEMPNFEVNALRLVTLGGISGTGDSGAPNIERVAGDGVFNDESDWDFGGG